MKARRAAGLAARVLVALLSVTVLVAVGSGWYVKRQLHSGTVASDVLGRLTPIPDGEPFTALLVGLDARTDASGNPLPPQLLDALHAGADEGQLHTDTMILLRVPGWSGGPATAISIPRDSYVPIIGERGKHKINSAYRRGVNETEKTLSAEGVTGSELDRRAREGGRQKLIATVENLTGVTIDHYAEINLAGFVELTEALGGVSVCLNKAVRDTYSGVDLPAGQQTVSGAAALAFVRQRHGLDGGDLDRIARQQAFAAGVAQRLPGNRALTDATRLNQLVDVVSRYVVLDRGWNLDQAVAQLRRFTGDEMVFRTIPTGRPDLETPVDGIAVEIDQDAVRNFFASLLDPAALDASAAGASATPSRAAGASATIAQAATPLAAATPSADPSASPSGTAEPTPTTTSRVITADGIPCVN
jgi:LCP family protein required for cell wall assembly